MNFHGESWSRLKKLSAAVGKGQLTWPGLRYSEGPVRTSILTRRPGLRSTSDPATLNRKRPLNRYRYSDPASGCRSGQEACFLVARQLVGEPSWRRLDPADLAVAVFGHHARQHGPGCSSAVRSRGSSSSLVSGFPGSPRPWPARTSDSRAGPASSPWSGRYAGCCSSCM